jgi:glucose/arabinose dehydrogenase
LKTKHLAAVAAAASLVAASSAQAETVETVATGLDNPRGVAVGPDDRVYVANTGRAGGKCVKKRGCFGLSGRVVRVSGDTVANLVRGFASLGEDRSGTFTAGVHGVSVAPDGSVYAVTGSATPKQIRRAPKALRRQVGSVFSVGGGVLDKLARVDRYEWANNVDGVRGDRNSNPYAVLALADRQIVVDAGANAVYEVRGSTVTLLAVIPKNGRAQPVPSSIAQGPDGAFYVGELAEGAGAGKARVFRIPAEGGTPTVHATGFSYISGVAFAPDGTLYVTEFVRNFRREDFRGRVVRVATDGTRTDLAANGELVFPTGAATDSTGALYVSNNSVLPRSTPRQSPFQGAGGALVKITP